jgi:hypothetical protein
MKTSNLIGLFFSVASLMLMIGYVLPAMPDQIDSTQQASEWVNSKGGVECPAIEVMPNRGKRQPGKKHIYNKDTVRVLVKTYHSTSSGLGVDTIMNTVVFIDTIKSDSSFTGDSISGFPCKAVKELLNTNWFFGWVHDTGVLKR